MYYSLVHRFAFFASAVMLALAHSPSMPPDPWDGVRVAHSPSMPPDPWDGVRLAHSPSMPPDTWDGMADA